jgi:hypothetical protein
MNLQGAAKMGRKKKGNAKWNLHLNIHAWLSMRLTAHEKTHKDF